jgi:hypothetical protein
LKTMADNDVDSVPRKECKGTQMTILWHELSCRWFYYFSHQTILTKIQCWLKTHNFLVIIKLDLHAHEDYRSGSSNTKPIQLSSRQSKRSGNSCSWLTKGEQVFLKETQWNLTASHSTRENQSWNPSLTVSHSQNHSSTYMTPTRGDFERKLLRFSSSLSFRGLFVSQKEKKWWTCRDKLSRSLSPKWDDENDDAAKRKLNFCTSVGLTQIQI